MMGGGGGGLDWFRLGYEQVADSCEQGTELLGSIKFEEFLG